MFILGSLLRSRITSSCLNVQRGVLDKMVSCKLVKGFWDSSEMGLYRGQHVLLLFLFAQIAGYTFD